MKLPTTDRDVEKNIKALIDEEITTDLEEMEEKREVLRNIYQARRKDGKSVRGAYQSVLDAYGEMVEAGGRFEED